MSTILDALRKVEEANRMKNTDVRTRLLTGSSRFDLRRPRPQRLSWFIVAGLILTGIIVGTGVGGWKKQHPSGVEPPGVGETPAASQVTESQHPPRVAKTPTPLGSEPTVTSQVAPVDQPAPVIAKTPFPLDFTDDVDDVRPKRSPSRPPRRTETPTPPASAPAALAQVAPADQPPPRIAETPSSPDPTSGVPTRPIPPVPNVAQGGEANVPATPAEGRKALDQTQAAPPNFPRASLSDRESGKEGAAIREQLPTNPVQRSPFVNTPEPERITPPPPSPPIEHRVTAKAKPPARPSPAPRVPASPETVTPSSVESTPAPLEEDVVIEATSPPTPATVSFLQWSPEPEKRMAFIKIGDAPTTLAHEGDTVNGVTVVEIRQGEVELQSGDSRWTLKTR